MELRCWFLRHAERRGLEHETDGNGIIWAWWDPAEHGRRGAIATGSHLDSVPGGGNFDGPLGVASALAAVHVLLGRSVKPARPLVLAVFPEEGGSRFGLACLGSRLATGASDSAAVRRLADARGITYDEAARGAGFSPERIGPDPDRLAGLAALVELHMEQVRGLIDLDRPVALAGGIIAHGRWHVRVDGRGDHAGATRMSDRQDPIVVAARVIDSLREQALAVGEARGTVGRMHVTPTAPTSSPRRSTSGSTCATATTRRCVPSWRA